MTTNILLPHPLHPVHAVESFRVKWQRDDGNFYLRFMVETPLDQIVLPSWRGSERADNLWQTTCFEMFARCAGDDAYAELNFSPSGQWAAYVFADYRDPLDNIMPECRPNISLTVGDNMLECQILASLPEPWARSPLSIGLSAVIACVDGTKSYWALAHPPAGPPDFHHPDCFALHLPAPEAA